MSTMTEFLDGLDRKVESCLSYLAQVETPHPGDQSMPEVVRRLRVALKNELEASELAALWMPTTPEIDVKLGLARQAGDEAKHYRLIEEHLASLGVDTSDFNPLDLGYSPMFQLLSRYTTTVERVAAAQYTRESLALTKNEQFIDYCTAVGAPDTARFYRTEIQPDEEWHVRLGRRTLEKYAVTPELKAKAEQACEAVLDLAVLIQNKQVHEVGLSHAPGC